MATTTQIQTTWYGMLQTYPDPLEPGRSGVGLSVGGATLPELMQSIYRGATYYHSLGYRVEIQRLQRVCSACGGAGETRGKITAKYKRCTCCKGQGVFESMPNFELLPSESVTLALA